MLLGHQTLMGFFSGEGNSILFPARIILQTESDIYSI